MDPLRFGIVGACGRGASFKTACEASGQVVVQAVCDIHEEGLPAAAERLGAQEQYTDYTTMLDRCGLDAVVIGTPMHFHAPMAVEALKRGVHVLSEVTAGVSIKECQELVAAAKASSGTYMLAENFPYMKPNAIVQEIVRQGLFGTPYYGEGEYLHELKELNEKTVWRRRWQTGVAGITYGTHSLGPLLRWFADDRVVRVCAAGGGHHHVDPRGDHYENDESSVMLCQLRSGGLVKIRVDMLSDRPHSMANYQLQGTDGCYESARAPGEKNRIWLRSRAKDAGTWMDLDELAEEFTPASWKEHEALAKTTGHGGGDFFEILDFIAACRGERPSPTGIHEAMDMSLPGLVSQLSMQEAGSWLDVPDSRNW
ncbi:MAG: Gfo/Idh/MocA family oxidoreductase [Victivallales bacterium]|jgi:predicted dehydrogenase|nr:Gfo/Idh/MocA family oxidoreductase [Victivallales bacterium]